MIARALGLLCVAGLLACGRGEAPVDTTPPLTTAHPVGGTYSTVQFVTLAAEEAATVHWTLEGAPLPPGHSGLGSAENPVYWIRIGPGTTTLRFFSVDRAGNREETRTETYVIEVPAP